MFTLQELLYLLLYLPETFFSENYELNDSWNNSILYSNSQEISIKSERLTCKATFL